MRTLVLALLAGAACSSSSSDPAPATSATTDAGPPPAAADASTAPKVMAVLPCAGVVVCRVACADGDATCTDACMAHASTSATAAVKTLDTCVATYACPELDCVNARCSAELAACVADDAPAASPAAGPGDQSALSGAILGTWAWTAPNGATQYVFKADGSFVRTFTYENQGACLALAKVQVSVDGLVEVKGTSITLTPKSATTTATDCAGTAIKKSGKTAPETYALAFPSNDAMTLTRQSGDAEDYARK